MIADDAVLCKMNQNDRDNHLVGGIPTPLKKYEFVSRDDDIPNYMESHNPFMFQTTNQ